MRITDAEVACVEIDDSAAQKIAEPRRTLGRQAIAVAVAQQANVRRMVEATVDQCGGLDVTFCNAGMSGGQSGPRMNGCWRPGPVCSR